MLKIVPSSSDVRVLGVTLSSDLTIDKHYSNVCSAGYYWLLQLRRVWRSLDSESAATLVYAFVTSRIDYCNVLLASAPKAPNDKLQRLLNAAAHLVSDRRQFGRSLRQLMHVDLHWFNMPERVKFKLLSMVHNCLHRNGTWYLMEYCIPVSNVASRWHHCSSSHHYLVVPRHSLSLYGRRAFAVASPTAWNSLSDDLRDPTLSTDSL